MNIKNVLLIASTVCLAVVAFGRGLGSINAVILGATLFVASHISFKAG